MIVRNQIFEKHNTVVNTLLFNETIATPEISYTFDHNRESYKCISIREYGEVDRISAIAKSEKEKHYLVDVFFIDKSGNCNSMNKFLYDFSSTPLELLMS